MQEHFFVLGIEELGGRKEKEALKLVVFSLLRKLELTSFQIYEKICVL
jgi:hypothetical protein